VSVDAQVDIPLVLSGIRGKAVGKHGRPVTTSDDLALTAESTPSHGVEFTADTSSGNFEDLKFPMPRCARYHPGSGRDKRSAVNTVSIPAAVVAPPRWYVQVNSSAGYIEKSE
jgi:hypothetical protein